MESITGKESLRELLVDWRRSGDHIALVPTMGNLHDGHMSLIALARQHAERIVVSVFVNPTQFAAGEDFAEYPRTLQRDARRLKQAKVDVMFAPDVDAIYPYGLESATTVHVPFLTNELCGASRPGHFDGVTSVVSRLLCLVQPDVVLFGQKDYQQQAIIRRMVTDLCMPIEVVTGPTQRDPDGLALSSRNQYLSDSERAAAPTLYAALKEVGEALETGSEDYTGLEAAALATLKAAGFQADYLSIRRADGLGPPGRDSDELVVLAAAWLGKTRLIDNIVVHI
ncbi:MAG: pantoate--beta-alanine ligase [Gammaproteobacteria bacterium]|nr:pantoate--beta-alanine ligase [Gammaproteobacteria bacterium]MDH4256716.1 pantoate--beta-alanine ligase [Gammaproteobacteria bacterium]MDH5311608.1 pantoate--beta-alanine ligase [Gammaproteobacteria bacterium]